MRSIVKVVDSALTKEELDEFRFHSAQIQEGMKQGQEAKRQVISHVLYILEKNLWRNNYSSKEEYIKTELNLEISSFRREAKNNKNYIYLLSNTEDKDEQITLTRMTGYAYRELRQISTDNKPVLKKGGELDEEYRVRLLQKEEDDLQLVLELWKEIYPRISKFKKESNTGIYPTGGYSITAKDIMETCSVLQQVMEIPKLLSDGVSPSDLSISSLEGKDISLRDVIEVSGDNSVEVIDAIIKLGISESLTEKLKRQSTHIKDSLERKYEYDKFEGRLQIENNRLIIENQFGKYDLLTEWSDMLGGETVISIRRLNRNL